MRRVVVLAVLLFGGCEDKGARDQIRELRARVDALSSQIATRKAAAEPLERHDDVAPAGATPDAVTIAFVQAVRSDPPRIARGSGLKLRDFLDENGLVFGTARLAAALRKKTIATYGKDGGQTALVRFFGPEVGNAVFYEKIADDGVHETPK